MARTTFEVIRDGVKLLVNWETSMKADVKRFTNAFIDVFCEHGVTGDVYMTIISVTHAKMQVQKCNLFTWIEVRESRVFGFYRPPDDAISIKFSFIQSQPGAPLTLKGKPVSTLDLVFDLFAKRHPSAMVVHVPPPVLAPVARKTSGVTWSAEDTDIIHTNLYKKCVEKTMMKSEVFEHMKEWAKKSLNLSLMFDELVRRKALVPYGSQWVVSPPQGLLKEYQTLTATLTGMEQDVEKKILALNQERASFEERFLFRNAEWRQSLEENKQWEENTIKRIKLERLQKDAQAANEREDEHRNLLVREMVIAHELDDHARTLECLAHAKKQIPSLVVPLPRGV